MITFLKAHVNLTGTYLDTILGNNLNTLAMPGFNESLAISMGWYNFSKNFSLGGEIEVGHNFGGVNGLKVCPALGAKWNF